MYNDTVPNQADNNMLTNGESKSILLRSLEVLDAIVQNDVDDEENNSFITEEEYYIGFAPGQPDNLFAFPNGKDVSDDPLFHNNHSTIKNEPNVGTTVTDVDNNCGVICDRSDDDNPLPLPPESPSNNFSMSADNDNDDSDDDNI